MIIKELFKKFFDYQFILIADYEELNKMLNHKRIFWLDIAKAYGIILVFYGHIIERFEALGISSMSDQRQIIYGFHIPLFFIVSGYFSKNSWLFWV